MEQGGASLPKKRKADDYIGVGSVGDVGDDETIRYLAGIMMNCTRFCLKHHKAIDHLQTYAANVGDQEPHVINTRFLLWWSWLNEVD
jgi:hypothetical protein